MSKREMREWLLNNSTVQGDAALEMKELETLRLDDAGNDVMTITTGCGGVLTIVCC